MISRDPEVFLNNSCVGGRGEGFKHLLINQKIIFVYNMEKLTVLLIRLGGGFKGAKNVIFFGRQVNLEFCFGNSICILSLI